MKKTKAETPVNHKSNPKDADLKRSLNRMKMIAMVLGAIILVGIAAVLVNTFSNNSDKSEKSDAAMGSISQSNAAPGQELQIMGNQNEGQMNQGGLGGGGNVAAPAGTTPPGMNPPHGQPGHKCEIPVGAPLDGSKPATSTSTSTTTTKSPVTTNSTAAVPSASAGSTPPGMNPPHGQPGHRCDIPVGSPLK